MLMCIWIFNQKTPQIIGRLASSIYAILQGLLRLSIRISGGLPLA